MYQFFALTMGVRSECSLDASLRIIQAAAIKVQQDVQNAVSPLMPIPAGKKRERQEEEGAWVEVPWWGKRSGEGRTAMALLCKAVAWMVSRGSSVFTDTKGRNGSRVLALINGWWNPIERSVQLVSIEWLRLRDGEVKAFSYECAKGVSNTQLMAQIDIGWNRSAYAIELCFTEDDSPLTTEDLWEASKETHNGFRLFDWISERVQTMF